MYERRVDLRVVMAVSSGEQTGQPMRLNGTVLPGSWSKTGKATWVLGVPLAESPETVHTGLYVLMVVQGEDRSRRIASAFFRCVRLNNCVGPAGARESNRVYRHGFLCAAHFGVCFRGLASRHRTAS